MRTSDYMELPYHITLVRDVAEDTAGWVASVLELPGCFAQGQSQEEALAHLRDVMESWLDYMLEEGSEVPLPADEPTRNGKILLRLPASLHVRLAREAELEGVSLNQYLLGIAAGAVGWGAKRSTQLSPVTLPSRDANRRTPSRTG
ncbi:MAG TPA: type II toxin-antitoxin system HicB family antitoxin [Tepidiformaceae bacterium]|nr:type II toxin-antitoxin system HicB family antitoxin [Tepidiformaceae bacterium]